MRRLWTAIGYVFWTAIGLTCGLVAFLWVLGMSRAGW